MSKRIICLIFLLNSLVLTGLAQQKAVVTSQTANLWAEPENRGEVITTFLRDSEVSVDATRRRNGFFYVSSNKKKGWVRGEKLDIKIQEPGKNTVWLYIGRTQRVNGFSVAYHLNVTQLVRNGDRIKFWTKAVPDVKQPYLAQLLAPGKKVTAADFEYNTDLWEGDCGTKAIRARRTLLFWRDGKISRFSFNKKKTEAASGSAGKSILGEACKIGKKM